MSMNFKALLTTLAGTAISPASLNGDDLMPEDFAVALAWSEHIARTDR